MGKVEGFQWAWCRHVKDRLGDKRGGSEWELMKDQMATREGE
jgi:hypothetical protein